MTFEDKLAQAEAIWAGGPRKFTTGMDAPAVKVHPGAEVHHAGLSIPQASRTLPTETAPGEVVNRFGQNVRQHAPGVYSTLEGRPIVHDGRAREFWKRRFNYQEGD